MRFLLEPRFRGGGAVCRLYNRAKEFRIPFHVKPVPEQHVCSQALASSSVVVGGRLSGDFEVNLFPERWCGLSQLARGIAYHRAPSFLLLNLPLPAAALTEERCSCRCDTDGCPRGRVDLCQRCRSGGEGGFT